jgi:hypothetical protein
MLTEVGYIVFVIRYNTNCMLMTDEKAQSTVKGGLLKKKNIISFLIFLFLTKKFPGTVYLFDAGCYHRYINLRKKKVARGHPPQYN